MASGNRRVSAGVGKRPGHGATASLSTTSYQSLRPHTAGSSNAGPPKVNWRSYQSEDFARKTRQVEEQIYTLENRREDKLLFSHTKNRRTSLLGYDMAQLIIEYLSILGMLVSSSLRWTWPSSWITAMCWTTLINLDIYDFAKIVTPNVYTSVQGGYTKSASVPVPFWGQMALWGIVTVIMAVSFLGIFLYLWKRRSPRYYIQMAWLRRVYLLITQFLALPFGVTLGKIFHCTSSTNLLDVDNTLVCWGGAHWAYVVTAVIAAAAFYFLIPAYMIYRTDHQIVTLTDEKHESYLRLKEHEYKRGLDALWFISEFFLFSSFRRSGVFYRPVMHLLKLILVGIYAALFNSMQLQGILFCAIFFLVTIVFAFVRPYRVTLLNIYVVICYVCLGSSALMGALRASFTSFSVATVFLLPNYTTGVLGIINGIWLLITIGFIIYAVRHRQRLWPKLNIDEEDHDMVSVKQDATTRKYVKAVLRAKAVIEYAVSMPPMFAPVHELSRQVLLVNALFREAEASKDPLQDTLWDILEEISQLHARLLPRSLFAESVKPSVRRTAAEFLSLMPQLARRLHQREYDFIMVHPVRRRILFKLFCLSVFLRGSREAREREFRINQRVEQIWRPSHEQEDVYYPSLYPEVEEGPSVLTVSMPIAKELRNDNDRRELELKTISDSLVDLTEANEENVDEPIDPTPSTSTGVINKAFESNEAGVEEHAGASDSVQDTNDQSNTPTAKPESRKSSILAGKKESSRLSSAASIGKKSVSKPESEDERSRGTKYDIEKGEAVELSSRPASGQATEQPAATTSNDEALIDLSDTPPNAFQQMEDQRPNSSQSVKVSPREAVLVDIGESAGGEKDTGLAPLG